MSCYIRHLEDIFDELGIQVTKENRKKIDAAIRGIVGTADKNCSETWKAIKLALDEDRESFLSQLREAVKPISK